MENLIVGLILILIISLAIYKIVKEKRSGNKCIGCPHGKTCTPENKQKNQ